MQDRWWLTGTVDGDEVERYPWLFRFGVDGTPEARLLPVEGEHYLGPMVGWNDGVLVGGFATHEDPQAEKRRLAIALGVDASLEVVDAWASTPELGSVATLLDVGGTLLVLAKPPSLDYADAVLIRLDALDRRPAWTRTIGVLGSASPNEIIAAAAARRHALFLSAATELDPDAPPSGPRPGGLPLIPPTRLRWSIDAWTVEGDLAWRHDLTTDHDGTVTVAASEDVILTWLGSRAPTEDEPSMLFAMDSDGHCICEQLTTLSGSVALAAAPTLGPDTFLVLGETEDETLGAQTWLARLHVVR